MGIKRYSAAYRSTNECDEGLYVLHEDHVASHAYDEAKERELFAKWKAYPIPPLNSDGQFDKEYLQREWSSWKACAKSLARSAE